ncbi:MAG: NADH-quinone oxidoreductase subunit NuoK [Actinobacteria bacterium]|nr:NADH-quinone oxidoreductase subunit NuoK [Actinomycetota bacterium]
MMSLNAFLVVGALLFSLGAAGVLIRRNLIVLLMCIELMLNGANLTLAAFGAYLDDMRGAALVVFALTVAAAEVAVGLAILVALSRVYPVVNVDELDQLRG